MKELQIAFLLLTVLIALIYDLKYRKIPNIITIPSMVVGIVLNIYYLGGSGGISSILGVIAGFLILLIPFTMKGIGAGDVKLLTAIGAFTSPSFVIWASLWMGIAGGVISFILYTLNWFKVKRKVKLENEGHKEIRNIQMYVSFPYGIAIFVGVMIEIFNKFWGF